MITNKKTVLNSIEVAKIYIKHCEAYLKEVKEYQEWRGKYIAAIDINAEPMQSRKFAKVKRSSMDLHEALVEVRKSPQNRK